MLAEFDIIVLPFHSIKFPPSLKKTSMEQWWLHGG